MQQQPEWTLRLGPSRGLDCEVVITIRGVLILIAAIGGTLFQSEARQDLFGTWKQAKGAVAAMEVLEQTAVEMKVHKAGFPSAVYRFDGTETLLGGRLAVRWCCRRVFGVNKLAPNTDKSCR